MLLSHRLPLAPVQHAESAQQSLIRDDWSQTQHKNKYKTKLPPGTADIVMY